MQKHKNEGGALPQEGSLQQDEHSEQWVYGEEDFFKDFFIARAFRLNFNYWFFPGLIGHELAHVVGCWLAGARVAKVVLWSPQGGYVVHQRARGSSSVVISLAPFLLNNFVALFFLTQSYMALQGSDILYALFSLWLGFSFAIYSFPSLHDLRMSVEALKRSMKKWGGRKDAFSTVLSLLVLPVIYFFYLIFITLMAIFAAGPGSRILWFVLLLAVTFTGTLGDILSRLR